MYIGQKQFGSNNAPMKMSEIVSEFELGCLPSLLN